MSVRAGAWASLVLCGLLASGCDRGAITGQTVARVNGETITRSELEQELDLLGVAPSQRTRARAGVLRQMVERKLMAGAAGEAEVDQTPAFVMLRQRAGEQMLADAYADQLTGRVIEPSADEVARYLAAHPLTSANRATVQLEEVQFVAADQGLITEIGGARTLADLVAVLDRHGVAYQRSRREADTADLPDEMLPAFQRLGPGEPLVLLQGPAAVAMAVAASTPNPAPPAEASRIAAERLKRQAAAKVLKDRLDALRADADIELANGVAAGGSAAPRPNPTRRAAPAL